MDKNMTKKIENFHKAISQILVEKLAQYRGKSTTKDIWFRDAYFVDASGTASFTEQETKQITYILSDLGNLFRTLNPLVLNRITTNNVILTQIKTFNNSKVRAGEKIENTTAHVAGFIHYMNDYYQKEEDKKSSPKGKAAVKKRKIETFGPIVRTPFLQLKLIFDFMNLVVEAKMMIVAKMNSAAAINTFLRTRQGLKVTSPEGYVAAWSSGGDAVKLVDRMEFSRTNFLATKNWGK